MARVRFVCPKTEGFSSPPRTYAELGSPSVGWSFTQGSGRESRGFLDMHWGQTLHRMKNDPLEMFK